MTALIVVTFFILLFTALFLKIEYGREFNTAIVSTACSLTDCSRGSIAFIGWLTACVTPLYVLVAICWWKRWNLAGHIAWSIVAVAICFVSVMFLQIDYDDSLVALSAGPGGPALLHGIKWGLGAWAAAGGSFLIWCIVASVRDTRVHRRLATGMVAAVVLVGGGLSCVTAPEPLRHLMTTQIFPDGTFRVQRDALTRMSGTDLVGCGGQYEGCLRTAELEFTTDDSDAVVRLEIVTMPHQDAAWDVQKAIPEQTGDPTTIRVSDVRSVYLVVATIRHADNRPIQAGEEKWLRWPARLLFWAFDESLGYTYRNYEPRPSDRSAPLTP